MNHRKLDFELLNSLFRYCPISGSIFNRIDRGNGQRKTGTIATSRRGDSYLQVQFKKNGHKYSYLAHRVAWLLHTGEDPGELQVDHINHDKSCNKIDNLRLVDSAGQNRNHTKSKRNKSGVTGVDWRDDLGKWRSRINDDYKERRLGYFEDKFEAICARKSAENRLDFHKNHGK